ncbi:MAG: peptidoglycan editing factor PgeF [Candidatus Aminicenantales bacterium]
MDIESQSEILTVPEFGKIPFLIHGFGNRYLKMEDFKQSKQWQAFKLISLQQIHSNIVHSVDKAPNHNLRGDALITNQPFLLLIIESADCLPVLMVEEKKKVIAAIHCGWKGTQKRIVQRVIQLLKSDYEAQPSSIKVALGPHIRGSCYEIGEEVRYKFLEAGFSPSFFQPVAGLNHQYLFDLAEVNLRLLIEAGVKPQQIFTIEICSHCHPLFPSYRRDKEKAGRMLSFIGLKF